MKMVFITIVFIVSIAKSSHAQTVPSYVPLNGLIGWWPFNGNSNDASGNGINGNPLGSVLSPDRFLSTNSSYFFDGNDEIDMGTDNLLNLNNCTFSAWVYISTNTLLWQTIISKYDVNWNGSYALSVTGNKANIWLTINSSNYLSLSSITSLNLNQWYHVATTHHNINGTKLYINGVLDNSDQSVFNILQAPNDHFRIGSQGSFYPVPMDNGKIDDIGVWNRELLPTEILDLYHSNPLAFELKDRLDKITFYPNPITSILNIDSKLQTPISEIKIMDVSGKVVFTEHNNVKSISVEHLANGLYFIQVKVGETIYQTKFVKE